MLEVDLKASWSYNGQRGTETFFHTAVGNFMTAMRDWAPGFRAMASEVLEPEVKWRFDSEGQGDWGPLAPSTIERKGSATILIDSGHLMNSFTSGGEGHVEEIDRQSMRWGSSVPHALFHQTGTGSGFQRRDKGPGRGMPMRKILEISAAGKRSMRSILVSRLATIARREGFGISKGFSPDALGARRIGQIALGLE